MLNRVFVLRVELVGALNHLIQQMQGGGVNIVKAEEHLKAFQKKIGLWKRRTENDNFVNFPLLDDCISEIEHVSGNGNISILTALKQTISLQFDELTKSLDEYFPNRKSYPAWVRQSLTFSVDKADVNDKYLDGIIKLQQSQAQQQLFRTTTLSTFWCHQIVAYPLLGKKALEILVPFVTILLVSLREVLFYDGKPKNEKKEQTLLRK